MIVGIDARIPIHRGRGWGRWTWEIVDALAAAREVELRVLLPNGPLGRALAERLRRHSDVRVAFAEFAPSSPDDYGAAAGGITLESALGEVDLLHSPTRFILPTESRPLVATVHDVAPLSVPPFKAAYREATLRAIDYIREHHVRLMTVSEFTRQELATRAGLDVNDVVVVPSGVSDVFLTAAHEVASTRGNYLLYVGGAGPNKNLDRLIAAVAGLRGTHPIDLLIAGDLSWDEDERRAALGTSVPPWIRLSGYVSDGGLAELYRHAAVCVFPSLHEGFGLPVLEAMACGAPVACSRIPVLEEVAGAAAAYFDPLCVEDITETMRSLLDDFDRRSVLAQQGRAHAGRFTWAATAAKTIAVYRDVLAT